MAVRADEGLARLTEPLQMHLVADAVAGAGEVDTVLAAHRLDVAVVVGVLKARLQGVVVDIGNRQLGAHAGDADGFKFKISHGSRGVLCQCLVNAKGNLVSGNHLALNKMLLYDFLCYCKSHDVLLIL